MIGSIRNITMNGARTPCLAAPTKNLRGIISFNPCDSCKEVISLHPLYR